MRLRPRQYQGRHWRTIIGIVFMLIGAGFVLLDKVWAHAAAASPQCPSSVLEVVHVWIFPVLLFAGGLALVSRAALNDVAGFGKTLAGH